MRTVTHRANLSDKLANTLRDMIIDGDIAAGQRLNEVHLAAELGVSRTPLREALSRLAAEGDVANLPRRGFFVKALGLEEFEQLHPVLALLAPEALRLAGLPSKRRLDRLASLTRKLAAATTPGVAIALADEWYFELVADCPNRLLLELIEQLTIRGRRYEMAHLRARQNTERTSVQHEEIQALLQAGDLDGAAAALRASIRHASAPIADWLRSR
jgi:DNA-binding GntR family transcriptional regulator